MALSDRDARRMQQEFHRKVAEFASREGLTGRLARQGAAEAIIGRLGGGAAAARAAGYIPAARGTPGGKQWEAAKRAFQRAFTGQQELSARYRDRLAAAATPRERSRLERAAKSKGREQINWPKGAAVRVTVAGRYKFSDDERDRDDLWAEIDGDALGELGSAPWSVWEAHLGVFAGSGDRSWNDSMIRDLEEFHSVDIEFVRRGSDDDLDEF